MGYTTEFNGKIAIEPPLSKDEISYINKFADTRRMKRHNGAYFVGGSGFIGQGKDTDVIDYNKPDASQPSLWCQWNTTEDGTAIVWDGNEKFYFSEVWMDYLITHFLGSSPVGSTVKGGEFLTGHVLNGVIEAQGEDDDDTWRLIVIDNKVFTAQDGSNALTEIKCPPYDTMKLLGDESSPLLLA